MHFRAAVPEDGSSDSVLLFAFGYAETIVGHGRAASRCADANTRRIFSSGADVDREEIKFEADQLQLHLHIDVHARGLMRNGSTGNMNRGSSHIDRFRGGDAGRYISANEFAEHRAGFDIAVSSDQRRLISTVILKSEGARGLVFRCAVILGKTSGYGGRAIGSVVFENIASNAFGEGCAHDVRVIGSRRARFIAGDEHRAITANDAHLIGANRFGLIASDRERVIGADLNGLVDANLFGIVAADMHEGIGTDIFDAFIANVRGHVFARIRVNAFASRGILERDFITNAASGRR